MKVKKNSLISLGAGLTLAFAMAGCGSAPSSALVAPVQAQISPSGGPSLNGNWRMTGLSCAGGAATSAYVNYYARSIFVNGNNLVLTSNNFQPATQNFSLTYTSASQISLTSTTFQQTSLLSYVESGNTLTLTNPTAGQICLFAQKSGPEVLSFTRM